nr:uncharacterized protein LOC114924754 [Arachis hypogaea]
MHRGLIITIQTDWLRVLRSLARLLSKLSDSRFPDLNSNGAKSSASALENPSSVYYLHLGENPGVSIVSVVLNTYNYNSWSRSMKRALRSKNKIGFIDGTLAKPIKNHPEFVAWNKCNTYVVSWINLLLSSDIAQNVAWHESAVDLWQDLEYRYYHGDLFRIVELQEELYAMNQGDLNITKYHTKMKAVWEDIESFEPVPVCVSCDVNCECGLEVVRNYRKRNYAVRFLRGLNEQFSGVRSQIMLMKPFPAVNEMFPLLTQQERQIHGMDTETRSFADLANSTHNFNDNSVPRGRGQGMRGGRGGRSGRNSPKSCSYYHKA